MDLKIYKPLFDYQDGITSIKTDKNILEKYNAITPVSNPDITYFQSRSFLPFEQGWFMKDRILTFKMLKDLFIQNHDGQISWRFMKQFVVDENALNDLPETHRPNDDQQMDICVTKSVQMRWADGGGGGGNLNVFVLKFNFYNKSKAKEFINKVFVKNDNSIFEQHIEKKTANFFEDGFISFTNEITYEIPITFPQLMSLDIDKNLILNSIIREPSYWKKRY